MKTKHESAFDFGVGNNYYYGTGGLPQDYKQAFKFYELAAIQAFSPAEYALGNCYQFGHGVKQNYSKAIKYYQKVVNREDTEKQMEALYELGSCNDALGESLPENAEENQEYYTRAAKYYKTSAERGYAKAQYKWGKINASGPGENYGLAEESNDTEAVKWFKRAADQGHAKAQSQLAHFYRHNFGVNEENLTQRERYEIALRYYKMAVDQGYSEAKKDLVETQYLLDHELPDDDDCYGIPDDLALLMKSVDQEQRGEDVQATKTTAVVRDNAIQPFSGSIFTKPPEENQSFTKDPSSSSGFRPSSS